MMERIAQELSLLRTRFPDLEYQEAGQWVLIPSFPVSKGWNRTTTAVAYQIPVGYPGTPPYSFFVPAGILFGDVRPNNYTEPASNQPLFAGTWGAFSWSHTEEWRATADLLTGSNLLHWTFGFAQRFADGV